ncbi:ABC transporter permease [Atopobiaceae bacterium 24-176]
MRSCPAIAVGAILLGAVILCALLVPFLSDVDPNEMAVAQRLRPPSVAHPLGTDEFGRDLFVRVMVGARSSLFVGCAVVALSSVVGCAMGVLAAWWEPWDSVLMRVAEGLSAIPGILLAIALVASFEAGTTTVVAALTVVYTPLVARLARGSALATRGRPYVEAARVSGASEWRIIWTVVVPEALPTIVVQASFLFAQAVVAEASLSFLGAGIPAPDASLGNILHASRAVLAKAPWMMAAPAAVMMLCVLGLNLLGDGLRDLLDPRVRAGAQGRRVGAKAAGASLVRCLTAFLRPGRSRGVSSKALSSRVEGAELG